jgi:hypothetical protein
MRIVWDALRGEHHGYVYIAGEVCQPFSMTGVGKTGEVEGVLVSGRCNDGIDFTVQRESDGGLDGVAGDAARPDDAVTILVRISAAEAPHANRDSALCRYVGDLVFGAHKGDVGFQRLDQRARGNLRTDTSRIAESHR